MEAPRAPRVLISGGASLGEALHNGAEPQWVALALARLTPPAAIAELLVDLVSDAASCVPGTVVTS